MSRQRTQGLIEFLAAAGAAEQGHANHRPLLEHLIETAEIVRRWRQPEWLQHAALLHSVYGNEVYDRPLLAPSRRNEVAAVAGERAERIAYLFGAVPRDELFAGTHLWRGEADAPATRDELDALVLLHMANMAEQARLRDGSPASWLVRFRELAELLIGSETVELPLFVAELAGLSRPDESLALGAYRAGLAEVEAPQARTHRLALAAAVIAVVPEPCIWLAHLSALDGDGSMAKRWAAAARQRLLGLGTTWDKRLGFDQWLELSHRLEGGAIAGPDSIDDPRALFEATASGLGGRAREARGVRDAAAGRRRFQRYMDVLARADGPSLRRPYPDLESRPWFEPGEFPLAVALQHGHEEIREEIRALGEQRFQPERERIGRSGEWDVVFLYERGRRREETCRALPATTRAVESHPAMRTAAGLIYVSRMRPGTHIGAHRGPTNIRVRCHLGVTVPLGDCAIRVGGETRRWREGGCLVFDDSFEHEAWNHTDDDRIVLIVDLWHPGLSDTEVRLLEGLHRYAFGYAEQLSRYWANNAAVEVPPSG